MSRRGLSTYVLNIQPLSHLLKGSKGQDPPSHTEKQHRPIVTTVGFWIQNKKIALSLSPPTLPCFTLTSHSLGRNHKMVFFMTVSHRKEPHSKLLFTINHTMPTFQLRGGNTVFWRHEDHTKYAEIPQLVYGEAATTLTSAEPMYTCTREHVSRQP